MLIKEPRIIINLIDQECTFRWNQYRPDLEENHLMLV